MVVLDSDYSVDTEKRVTNFEDEVLKYTAEIVNWALYTPLVII